MLNPESGNRASGVDEMNRPALAERMSEKAWRPYEIPRRTPGVQLTTYSLRQRSGFRQQLTPGVGRHEPQAQGEVRDASHSQSAHG